MLARWNPFDELVRFGCDFHSRSLKPAVDIYEDKERIVMEAELPGVDPKDVDIEVDNSVLTLKGKVSERRSENGREYSRIERTAGAFLRSFVLPTTVEAGKISASYDKGVLVVTIPKKAEVVPRRIEISGI